MFDFQVFQKIIVMSAVYINKIFFFFVNLLLLGISSFFNHADVRIFK